MSERPGRVRRLWSGPARLVHLGSALLVLLVLGGILVKGLHPVADAAATTSGPPTLVRSQPAPDLSGTTLDGGRLDLAELRGRPVLVNMWATWCDPCRAELPLLDQAAQRWAPRGLAVVGVDMRDNAEAARALLAELGVTAMTVVQDTSGALAVSWGVLGVPETFLVDRDGVVRFWARGAVTATWLEEHLPTVVDQ